MASFVDAFIAQEMDPMAQINKQFIISMMDNKRTEGLSTKVETVLSIGAALESDVSKNNVAVRDALEKLLKQLNS